MITAPGTRSFPAFLQPHPECLQRPSPSVPSKSEAPRPPLPPTSSKDCCSSSSASAMLLYSPHLLPELLIFWKIVMMIYCTSWIMLRLPSSNTCLLLMKQVSKKYLTHSWFRDSHQAITSEDHTIQSTKDSERGSQPIGGHHIFPWSEVESSNFHDVALKPISTSEFQNPNSNHVTVRCSTLCLVAL